MTENFEFAGFGGGDYLSIYPHQGSPEGVVRIMNIANLNDDSFVHANLP